MQEPVVLEAKARLPWRREAVAALACAAALVVYGNGIAAALVWAVRFQRLSPADVGLTCEGALRGTLIGLVAAPIAFHWLTVVAMNGTLFALSR
ncbi:MAG: hypothetical protein HYS09_06545 [Chloroflexi bacterium]|nr:hypothetical protein [Chloroflexota bacterium]